VGVLRERFPGENRVSQSPDSVASLVKAGFNVVVEAGGACAFFSLSRARAPGDQFFLSCLVNSLLLAFFFVTNFSALPLCPPFLLLNPTAGERAEFPDSAYEAAGATVVTADQVYTVADIVTQIRPPTLDQVPRLAKKTLVSLVQPGINPQLYDELAIQRATVFALDCVPRMLSRGQAFDVLSSQANVSTAALCCCPKGFSIANGRDKIRG
jgi:NAD(P) transhydrogenase